MLHPNRSVTFRVKAPAAREVLLVGEWNSLRVEAKGAKLAVHLNGEKVQDLDLAPRVVAGFQWGFPGAKAPPGGGWGTLRDAGRN